MIYRLLALLLALAPLHSAVLDNGILAASGTTGTNATVRSVTITSGTNLNAGVLNATNDIRLAGNSIITALTNKGDFSGPSSSTNNNLVSFNGTTGKIGKDANIKTDGSGGITTAGFYQAGEGAPSNGWIRYGSNTPSGYLMRSSSASGASTNLGFNWTHSATYFDAGLPPDEVSMWGYNITPGGSRLSSTDTALAHALEGNYNTGGAEFTEAHLHFIDKTNVQHRLYSYTINKNNFGAADLYHTIFNFHLKNLAATGEPDFFQVTPTGMIWRSTNANVLNRSVQWTDDGFNVTLTRMPGTADQGDFITTGWRNWNLPAAQFNASAVRLSAYTDMQSDNSFACLNSANNLESIRLRSSTGITVGSDIQLRWSSTTSSSSGSYDTGLARDSAGVVRVSNGSTGTGQLLFRDPLTVGSTVTLGAANTSYLVNTDAITVTLPTAVGVTGKEYVVKTITPATSATIATTSSQKIDGASTYSLSASNKFVRVQSDGTNWWVTGAN